MTALLDARSLDAGYGDVLVLHDVSLHVGSGEIVAVVGANGAGKTTLLSSLAGLIRPTKGTIRFKGEDLGRVAAQALPGRGFALVPEGGRLFPFMTVEENLELGGYPEGVRGRRGERMLEVFEIFPVLRERRKQMAGKLSGGERQMCAIARAIMSRPTLLALDEPSVGLSPLMVSRVFATVKALAERENLAVLIVEQNVAEALEIASRAYILDHGRIVRQGRAGELREDRAIQETYMGL
jgi:branched-chain amino acid transport system ATP-binding protein